MLPLPVPMLVPVFEAVCVPLEFPVMPSNHWNIGKSAFSKMLANCCHAPGLASITANGLSCPVVL